MKSQNFGYIPALDHLRGFAAVLVLFFHAVHFISHGINFDTPYTPANWPLAGNPFTALIIEGHTAVSLFFVLSGFVFTVGSLDKKIQVLGFYRNRFFRTYPLFCFFILLGIIFHPENVTALGLLKSLFFMANDPGAFAGGAFTWVSWSIAVEWQFYLVFPLLLYLLRRFGWAVLPALLLVFLGARLWAWSQDMDMLRVGYWSIVGRMDQFLLGMLAGVYYHHRFKANTRHDVLAAVGAVMVLTGLYVFNQSGGGAQNTVAWVFWPTLDGLAWAIFLLGYLSLSRVFAEGLSSLLIALGTISYSFYLSHFVVLDFFMRQGWDTLIPGTDPVVTALLNTLILITPVVILLSALTYRGIERPFLGLRKKYTSKQSSIEQP